MSSISVRDVLTGSACHSPWQCSFKNNATQVPSWVPPTLLLADIGGSVFGHANSSVGGMLHYLVRYETFMFDLIGSVLSAECGGAQHSRTDEQHNRTVFVDSGANEGLWSLMAGTLGCHVIAVEPQPRCLEWIRASLAINAVATRHVHLWPHFLSPDASATLDVPADTCIGSWRASNSSSDQPQAATASSVSVRSARLDASEYLRASETRVALWHVDTEGAEATVLSSARCLFERGRIDRVVLELTPTKWKAFNLSVTEGYAELAERFTGFRCWWACTGALVDWRHEAARVEFQIHRGGHGGELSRIGGGLCRAPWAQAPAVDVYCVREGVAPIFSHLREVV